MKTTKQIESIQKDCDSFFGRNLPLRWIANKVQGNVNVSIYFNHPEHGRIYGPQWNAQNGNCKDIEKEANNFKFSVFMKGNVSVNLTEYKIFKTEIFPNANGVNVLITLTTENINTNVVCFPKQGFFLPDEQEQEARLLETDIQNGKFPDGTVSKITCNFHKIVDSNYQLQEGETWATSEDMKPIIENMRYIKIYTEEQKIALEEQRRKNEEISKNMKYHDHFSFDYESRDYDRDSYWH